ncbi:MAG: hypothetical protein ACRDOS_01695 [Gaiellaceae bacterium]
MRPLPEGRQTCKIETERSGGFHFTMGALIAVTIACCVLILLAVLAGLAFG